MKPTPPASLRVALYARISEDATGQAIGVSRQLEDAREMAATRGFDVVAEVSDNDISALKGKHRPGYERVLAMVRTGEVDHVIVWQTSRLLRNRRERAEAIELFARQQVGILTVKGQDLDLSTAYGRGMAGLLGEFDTMESEVKSERVLAAAADRARRGRPSAYLGYGWTTTGKGREAVFTVNMAEAEVVREITRRLLANESLLAVTADLNRRGVPGPYVNTQARKRHAAGQVAAEEQTVHGFTWARGTVKKLAVRASNAGLLIHHRGRPTESLSEGVWPPLVPRADWDRLQALLTAPERQRTTGPRPGARKHLLSYGIGECGVCGSQLRVRTRSDAVKYPPLYICDGGECVGRSEQRVDQMAAEYVALYMSKPENLTWMMGDEAEARVATERVVSLHTRLAEAADRYADGKIDADMMERITARVRPQIAEAEQERNRHARSRNVENLTKIAGPAAGRIWSELSVAQQRMILAELRMRVVIKKTRRGPGFDSASVDIYVNGARLGPAVGQ